MTTQDARTALRRLVLLGTPVLLGALVSFHPLGVDLLADLGPRADWFIILHVLMLPLFGLMAVALVLLAPGAHGRALAVARAGVWLFAILYPVFDAIAGIARGMALRMAVEAQAEAQQALVALAAEFGSSPVTQACGVLGGVGFFVAASAAATTLARRGAPRGALVCLVLGSLIFGISHTPPIGPVGLLLFVVGAAWLEFSPRLAGHPTQRTAAPPAAAPA
jgi:hypothetical protein